MFSNFSPNAQTLDYTQSPIEKHLASSYSLSSSLGFNLILDTMGSQPIYNNSVKYLLPGCQVINVGGKPPKAFFSLATARVLSTFIVNGLRPTWLGGTPRKWTYAMLEAKTQYLEDLAKWAEEGE